MSALSASQRRTLASSEVEVRWDDHSRSLYATDASIYQLEPLAVAFPRSAREVSAAIRAAAEAGLPVTPRGAGTGLAGGALGDGLVLELSLGTRWIADLEREARTVRVGAGVVLDQLNAWLAPHGLWFGPDVATSSRASLGGMIANNSSGAHAPVYGTTAEHVVALEVVLADGSVAWVGRDHEALAELREQAAAIVRERSDEIARRLPPGLVKRWPGLGLDGFLRHPDDLARLLAGSEGALAVITSALLRVVPRPRRRSLAVIFFASVGEALQATVELFELEAAAIEHLDRLVFDQTRGQRAFAAARDLLGLDASPCEALLLVELFDDDGGRLQGVAERGLGLRTLLLDDPAQQELVWAVRRAGLSLVTACPGPAKPVAGIEDVCVPPEKLPEYVAGLREILAPLGVEASFYGHAAAGTLHVRPKLDLHTAADRARLRQVADAVSDLCRRFGGSLTSEHGAGMARTEYLATHLGPELSEATRRIKQLFDPRNLLNPGKIVDTGAYRIDTNLRQREGGIPAISASPALGFVARDRSAEANLEQCNGCGACRKLTPTMCPTFRVTGEEWLSTRGRANTIRGALEGRFAGSGSGLAAVELERALASCLSCKACLVECPSNVDLALLKAELVEARHRAEGVPLRDRLIAAADTLGRLGSAVAPLANLTLAAAPVRHLLGWTLGLDPTRSLPAYSSQRFDRWFAARSRRALASRGRVILWDDTWVRYHRPGPGMAAVAVLEAAGFEVVLAEGRECCGRPAFSRGLVGAARRMGLHNVALLGALGREPVVFLEPSCYSMFVDEYLELEIPDAEAVAGRCLLFEDFLERVLAGDPQALDLEGSAQALAVHGHCHAKALADPAVAVRLLRRIPGAQVRLLDSGCCGMAGAFGMMKSTAALSREVARPLVELVETLPAGTVLVAAGTSCRQQVEELTGVVVRHPVEVLAKALRD